MGCMPCTAPEAVSSREHLSTDSVREALTPAMCGQAKQVDANLGEIITSNRGFFSRGQAIDCGESDRALRDALRAGEIVQLRRGM